MFTPGLAVGSVGGAPGPSRDHALSAFRSANVDRQAWLRDKDGTVVALAGGIYGRVGMRARPKVRQYQTPDVGGGGVLACVADRGKCRLVITESVGASECCGWLG